MENTIDVDELGVPPILGNLQIVPYWIFELAIPDNYTLTHQSGPRIFTSAYNPIGYTHKYHEP